MSHVQCLCCKCQVEKVGGVRGINFVVGKKLEHDVYTKSKCLNHFQASENATVSGMCFLSYMYPKLYLILDSKFSQALITTYSCELIRYFKLCKKLDSRWLSHAIILAN